MVQLDSLEQVQSVTVFYFIINGDAVPLYAEEVEALGGPDAARAWLEANAATVLGDAWDYETDVE